MTKFFRNIRHAVGKTKTRLFATVGGLLAVALVAGIGLYHYLFPALPQPVQVFDVMWLKQGWTEDQREKYYQTSQGTLIIPYSWFFALEMMPTTLFVANEGPATWWRP